MGIVWLRVVEIEEKGQMEQDLETTVKSVGERENRESFLRCEKGRQLCFHSVQLCTELYNLTLEIGARERG